LEAHFSAKSSRVLELSQENIMQFYSRHIKRAVAIAVATAVVTITAFAASPQSPPGAAPTKIDPSVIPGPKLSQTMLQSVRCPGTITAAATNAPPPWLPSAASMNVVDAKLSNQPAAQQQMLCYYEGSGSKWSVGRNIQPEFKSCTVATNSSFSCLK
jgi:hypothetical protein